jgi:hypothetical protein
MRRLCRWGTVNFRIGVITNTSKIVPAMPFKSQFFAAF